VREREGGGERERELNRKSRYIELDVYFRKKMTPDVATHNSSK